MPLFVPPAIAAPASAADLNANSPLTQAHATAVGAIAIRWDWPQGTTPGLAALLNRFNPALNAPASLSALAQADRQALAVLGQQGWLTEVPANSVQPTHQVGMAVWDQVDAHGAQAAQVSLDPDVAATFGPLATFPVLFRWVALFHEAGHVQLARDRAGFSYPAWSEAENHAMDQQLRGPAGRPRQAVAQFFGEAYADAFALLALLHQAGDTPAVRQTITEWIDRRVADGEGEAGVHATGPLLQRLQAELNVGGWAQVPHATPEALRAWARRVASEGTVTWLTRHPDQIAVVWAGALPDQPTEAQVQAFGQAQAAKLGAYLNRRLAVYARASDGQPAPPSPTDGDPLLEAMADQDTHFRDLFDRQATGEDRQVVLAFMERPALAAADQQALAQRMDRSVVVRRLQHAMLATAQAFLESPQNPEIDYERRRLQPLASRRASLRRP